jgi:acyl-CoA thioesterase-1
LRRRAPLGDLFRILLALGSVAAPFWAGSSGCGDSGMQRNAARDRSAGEGVTSPIVLFVGTSLTAGYGLRPEQAYPALIQEKIREAGLSHRVVNAGVSGETAAGALGRLDRILQEPFELLVVELGVNDLLRGAELDPTRQSIQAVLDRVREVRPESRIVLIGLEPHPRLTLHHGPAVRDFYADLAQANGVALVPSLLEGVAGRSAMNLPDGFHPNAAGHRRMAENVWGVLEGELR